jgi:hypothetical protein
MHRFAAGFLLLLCIPGQAALAQPVPRWSEPEYAGSILDPVLEELSGLAASRVDASRYWGINDGDSPPVLVAIERQGRRLLRLPVAGVENRDWEDLASFTLDGRPYLLVADTGDNGGIRETLDLYVVEEPRAPREGQTVQPAWTIRFRWPDGARDCEAVAVDAARGQILLVSKKRVPPELFVLTLRPAADEVQVAQKIGELGGIPQPTAEDLRLNPIYGRYRAHVTGADLSPGGRVLAVLNYRSVYLYTRAAGGEWTPEVLSRPLPLALPWLPQAEAIAFSRDGRQIVVGSEQIPSPLLRFRLIP